MRQSPLYTMTLRLLWIGGLALLFGCKESPEPLAPLNAGIVATVDSCETVTLPQTRDRPGPWLETRNALFGVQTHDDGTLSFRAPAVAKERTLTLRSSADGSELSVVVRISKQADAIGLAPGCPPFEFGVASGDPTAQSVYLWTRANVQGPVTWQISEHSDFQGIAQSGTIEADASRDFTLRVLVNGLQADTTYYYRFVTESGAISPAGRTRTAGPTRDALVRFALVSCSSLFSGYFNGYEQIAARDDLNLVVHLGDYIYDYVDPDEVVRIPTPAPTEPDDLASHRQRHALYLKDPDLRAARAAHPWFVLWDNHDLEASKPPAYEGGLQAFREWIPMADAKDTARGYRRLQYGELVDIWLIDALLHKDKESLPNSDEKDMLGKQQWAWLSQGLSASSTQWRVIGNQKLFAQFDAPINLGGSTWKAYPGSRTRLLKWIQSQGISDTLFVSGDAHFTVNANLLLDNKADQPVAVELLGASLTRGNIDETVKGGPEVYTALRGAFKNLNPHFADVNLIDHGFGIVAVTPNQVKTQMWYTPILKPSDELKPGPIWSTTIGQRRWQQGAEK